MKATQMLHELGQSLWLDNITRDMLQNATPQRYIDELSITGLTSNPTIFNQATRSSGRANPERRCYVKALATPFTVNTMPESTLKALADHGHLSELLPVDGGDCEDVLAEFARAGVDINEDASTL